MNIKCYDKNNKYEKVLYNDYGFAFNTNKSIKINRKDIFCTNQNNYFKKKLK